MTSREKLTSDVKQFVVEDAKKQSLHRSTCRARQPKAFSASSVAPELYSAASTASDQGVLEPLTITNTMQPVDVGDGQPNALSVANQAYGLEMTVPVPVGVREVGYRVDWFINGLDTVQGTQHVDMSPGNTWPVSFFLGTNWFTSSHGQYFITYKLFDEDNGNQESSRPTFYWVDTRNPVLGSARPLSLIPPSDLPAPYTVTIEYLNSNQGIELQVPSMIDWKIGDTFSVFVGRTELLTDAPITSMPPFAFTLDAASIIALGQGVKDFAFAARDRAGNETNESQVLGLDIVLSSAPGPLDKPRIPESPVTRSDAADGVIVYVDTYPNALAGDSIVVNWNGTLLPAFVYPEDHVTVPYATVAFYGDDYDARVTYTVHRGQTTSPESDEELVPVDITVVGPVNPDFPPSLVNPNLDKARLQVASAAPNTITPTERGLDATVTVPLYATAKIGDAVQVFYNNSTTPVEARKALVQDDLDAGEVTFMLSSTLIESVGNGNIALFYRIYEDLTVDNFQQSPDQDVQVTVSNLTHLPEASFPQRVTTVRPPIINCSVIEHPSTRGDITVRMEFNAFDEGDRLTLHWVMHNQRGTLPGGNYTPPNSPVEATRVQYAHTVTAGEASNTAVNFVVQWGSPHLADVTDGAIEVYWQIEKAGGVRGTSESSYVNLSRIKPGNTICSPFGS